MSKIKRKIDTLLELRSEILEDAKTWKGKKCPLEQGTLDHAMLAQLFTGLGCWGWDCPFCGQEFEE